MIKCGQCKFWEPRKPGGSLGSCRIYPPTIVGEYIGDHMDTDVAEVTAFPATYASDWCGEGRINDVPDRD